MRAIKHKYTTSVLVAPKGQEDTVCDLPICRTHDSDGNSLVISVWELSDEDVEELIKNKKLYFSCMGLTHPPIQLSIHSIFVDGS